MQVRSTRSRLPAQRGFTLVELLVVIAILAILISLVFPMVSSSLDRAKRVACMSKQRQCVTALLQYVAENQGYLAPVGHARNWRGVGKVEHWYAQRWLGKYLETDENVFEIITCPMVTAEAFNQGGIGYNHHQLGRWLGNNHMEKAPGEQPRLWEVESPAGTVAFADSAYVWNPNEPDPDQWRFNPRAGSHLFRTPDNRHYVIDPARAVNRHNGRAVAAFLDGNVRVVRVGELGFQYPKGDERALWDVSR